MRHAASEKRNAVLMQRLRGCKRGCILLSALAVVQALLAVCFSLATKNVVNRAVRGEALREWGILLIAFAVALPSVWGLRRILAQKMSDKTAMLLRSTILDQLQRKQYQSLHNFHAGVLLDRLQKDVEQMTTEYLSIIPIAVGEVAQLFGAMGMLIVIRAPLAAVVVLSGVALAVCGVVLRRLLRRRYCVARETEEALTAAMQENLEQLELMRCVPPERAVERVDQRQKPWLRARCALRNLQIGGSTLFTLAIRLGTAALLIWGAIHIRSGNLYYGDLTAMLQLLNLFQSPVTGLTGLQVELAAVDAAWERVGAICNLPDEPHDQTVPANAKPLAVCFRDVTFRYAPEEPAVFSRFSATIPLDRWTRLSGVSGRGKSTFYRLVLGLFRPEEGEILLQTDCGTFPCGAETRRFFAWVPQTPILFSGSVRENLLLFAPKASEADLQDALNQAQCDFIRRLPQGMDTPVGQFGEGLSVGQRQRLVIARAILCDADVLLLDEITSALDQLTAEALLNAIQKHHPAALIATHRNEIAQSKYDQCSLEGNNT